MVARTIPTTGEAKPKSEIVSLHGHAIPTQEPDHEVIEMLQDLMESALTGDLQGMAWVGVYKGNTTSSNWTGNVSSLLLLGLMVQAQHDLAQLIHEAD